MTHLSENGVYLTESLVDRHEYKQHCFGLVRQGQEAIEAAEGVLGVPANPLHHRDTKGVRGLASAVLRNHFPNRHGWSDIAWAVYGRRNHSTAIYGSNRWADTIEREQAIQVFKSA